MHYLGGKSRYGREISFAVHSLAHNKLIYEPFCGALWVTQWLQPIIASDINVGLIELYQAIRNGWEPPDSIDEEEYRELHGRCIDGEQKPEITFAGFAASWGGKWFGGYARGDGRNYVAENKKSLMDKMARCRSVQFEVKHYSQLDVRNSVIYCDPPYAGTTQHCNFSTPEFWDWANKMSDSNNVVIVSEYKAPPGWKSIWMMQHFSSLETHPTLEQLWTKE